jgi:hypothetical protein
VDDAQSHVTIETEYDEDGNPVDFDFHTTMDLYGAPPYFHNHPFDPDVSDEDEEDGDDDMDGFIDDQADGGDDYDDDDEEGTEATMTSLHPDAPAARGTDRRHSEVALGINARSSPYRFYGINGIDGSDDGHSDSDQATNYDEDSEIGTNYDEQSEVNTNYDDQSEANTNPGAEFDIADPRRSHAPSGIRSRAQRIVLSDSEDEGKSDEEAENGSNAAPLDPISNDNDNDNDNENDNDSETSDSNSPSYSRSTVSPGSGADEEDSEAESEESVRPPQPAARRRQHLQHQRARRDGDHLAGHDRNGRPAGGNRGQNGHLTYQGGFGRSRGHPFPRMHEGSWAPRRGAPIYARP